MVSKLDIRLSHNKIKKLRREDLEDQFMENQDELFRKGQEITKKDQEIQTLKEKLKEIENNQKTLDANRESNQPSSKQPEWDKDGNLSSGKSKKKKNGGRRKGSGNKKKYLIPTEENTTPLNSCPDCGSNLQDQPVLETRSRLVEDIPENQEPVVSEEIIERKWCSTCRKTASSLSERALPGSDYGLNTMILCTYLWVVTAISFPGISKFLSHFWGITISTSGISRMMVRLGEILTPVYQEILTDVKSGPSLWADETGWRIRGQLHWLWIFANKNSSYYWMDKSRGSDVVRRILGDVFAGVLITDGWVGYNQIVVSDRQTCMAHIFRKIRKYIEVHPQFRSVLKFYLKLRRILKDAEKLKVNRGKLGELVFHRRFKLLETRLSTLLEWKNPNPVLKEVIDKVKRQKDYILTFVLYEDAESHNNYAEGIIRKGVVKRKISGGSTSLEGAKAYGIILSVVQTCYLRKLSVCGFLKSSLIQYIRTGAPMLLSQYEMKKQSKKEAA